MESVCVPIEHVDFGATHADGRSADVSSMKLDVERGEVRLELITERSMLLAAAMSSSLTGVGAVDTDGLRGSVGGGKRIRCFSKFLRLLVIICNATNTTNTMITSRYTRS